MWRPTSLNIEAADESEHERAIGDLLTKGTKISSHALQFAAVVDDVEVALLDVAELLVEDEGARLPVPKELGFNGEPSSASADPTIQHSVGEVGGEGAEDPRLDHAVHAHPVRRGGEGGVAEDMVAEGVLPKDEQEGLLPPEVEGGLGVEDDRHQGADALDGDGLRVEVDCRDQGSRGRLKGVFKEA